MINFIQKDALDVEIKKDLNILGIRIHDYFQKRHPMRRVDSFKYAFKGVFHALVNEPNFRIQLVLVACATALGAFFRITTVEWALFILASGLLLSAEMINTVVEEFMDHLIPEESTAVAIIKDLAAGFVLLMAFTNLAILILIFGKYFIALL